MSALYAFHPFSVRVCVCVFVSTRTDTARRIEMNTCHFVRHASVGEESEYMHLYQDKNIISRFPV